MNYLKLKKKLNEAGDNINETTKYIAKLKEIQEKHDYQYNKVKELEGELNKKKYYIEKLEKNLEEDKKYFDNYEENRIELEKKIKESKILNDKLINKNKKNN